MSKVPYYRGVRGSAALATRALAAPATAAEALAPGEMRRVPFAGELLGAVRVRGAYAALPLEAFDRACAALEAEEQAAYLHLLRLSVAEGRNFCRIAKRDLAARLRLSERRLLRVLDALVARGFARPLDRDNRGTLWRVYLPREAFGEPLGDDVLVGRAVELRVVKTATSTAISTSTSTSTPTPTPTATPTPTPGEGSAHRGPRPVHTEASLARALAVARGRTDADGVAAAARDVKELLAEGQRPERIAAAVETIRRRAARAGPGTGGTP
ncbi:MAG TPA: hypothetical protein VFL83_06060 [Anaeromyxobacter sp.]|nr:hypothetical protein [Anaeromyxobacter sp.]